ncbi:MAG: bifunctional demethylmenaquinone methyltransferase/2-methoxy-6-polyprenyl-1,4-benzoquinol methylase UbiE [Thiotrichales bacterium]
MTQEPPRTTHFGYQEVPVEEKSRKVAEVFHAVAGKYDLMNDAMSFGIHRLWKRYTVLQAGVRPGMRVLDLAGGTGDLARQFAAQVGPAGEVVLADINSSMLAEGRRRMVDAGIVGNVRYAQVNAECLPFPTAYFDVVTIAFGLRNVTDKDTALASMRRVIKPGGKLLVLEFSKPPNALFGRVYDTYSFTALPLLGKLIAGDSDSYRYLAESIRMHPDQETLKAMMEQAGFDRCDYFNLTGGVVALHRGYALD